MLLGLNQAEVFVCPERELNSVHAANRAEETPEKAEDLSLAIATDASHRRMADIIRGVHPAHLRHPRYHTGRSEIAIAAAEDSLALALGFSAADC